MKKFNVYVTRSSRGGPDLLRETCNVEINPEDRPSPGRTAEEREGPGRRDHPPHRPHRRRGHGHGQGVKGFANYAVGFDNLDVKAATARKIPLSNTPGVLTIATAEMAWALLFAIARRLIESEKVMRSGTWTGWGPCNSSAET